MSTKTRRYQYSVEASDVANVQGVDLPVRVVVQSELFEEAREGYSDRMLAGLLAVLQQAATGTGKKPDSVEQMARQVSDTLRTLNLEVETVSVEYGPGTYASHRLVDKE